MAYCLETGLLPSWTMAAKTPYCRHHHHHRSSRLHYRHLYRNSVDHDGSRTTRRGILRLLFAVDPAARAVLAIPVTPPVPNGGRSNNRDSSSGSSKNISIDEEDAVLARIEPLLLRASQAWGEGLDPSNPNRFKSLDVACRIFDTIVALDPRHIEWLEARGQVRIDSKRFEEAVSDFTEVIRRTPDNFRAYSGRALAHEGLGEWRSSVDDYTRALEVAQGLTGSVEPYIMNSRGNAFASLGQYSDALQDYLQSVQGFQKAKELDGAIYAASNAALMRIQLGDDEKGMKELMGVARRAPASIDMRAALAALYWSRGEEEAAEEEWRFTCENINAGQVFDNCGLYRDSYWLSRIRRWPPVMVERMDNFLKLRSSKR